MKSKAKITSKNRITNKQLIAKMADNEMTHLLAWFTSVHRHLLSDANQNRLLEVLDKPSTDLDALDHYDVFCLAEIVRKSIFPG